MGLGKSGETELVLVNKHFGLTDQWGQTVLLITRKAKYGKLGGLSGFVINSGTS